LKVLVTGGAGFIGSTLVDRLLGHGHSVTALDNFDDHYPRAVKQSNIEGALRHPGFRLVEGDIRDAALLDQLLGDGAEHAVVHLAARPGPRPSIDNPQLYYDVNLMGILSVLDAARRNGVRSLVFSSSSSVYGLNEKMPFHEDDPINRPASPYAASKIAAEALCHSYAHVHGLPIHVLRLFTVYGPRQRPDMAMRKFARLILAGEPIEVYGDGTSVRDYTYVEDVAAILERLLYDPPPEYQIFNIAGGSRVPLLRVIETLQKELGREAKVRHIGPQMGDVPGTWGDVTRARQMLGYHPQVDYGEGIARLCREHGEDS